jgi:GH25 family lysozyme M1 (1,4-beta-N-acetylmuramidase)
VSKTPGIDVSRWQGEINWSRVAEAGYRFVGIRATIGNYYTDPWFYVNWAEAMEAGLLVSAYHVVVPDRPADSQIERFFDVLADRRSDFPPVLDVEVRRGASPEDITTCFEACADLVQQADGRRPVIYTARWFWDRYVLDSPEWTDFDLWVAHYGVESPRLPGGWAEWRFWQYSDHGRVPGIGTPTDLNWFNGSYDDLLAYAEAGVREVEPPVAGLQARVRAERLGVRSGPGLNYEVVEELREGDVVHVVSVAGEDVWVEIEPGKWVPFRSRGQQYIEIE